MMKPTQSPPTISDYGETKYKVQQQSSSMYGTTRNMASGDVGIGGTRRRNHRYHDHETNKYSVEKLHINNEPFSRPREIYLQQKLQSLTFGGYGPIDEDEYIEDKQNQRKGRSLGSIFTFLRTVGCSNFEMLQVEAESGDYYLDKFNDESWSCSMGTSEENGIWCNASDHAGTLMAFLVWFLLGYSTITITFLTESGSAPVGVGMIYCILCALALASHAKTMFTDPGCVPQSAVPQESVSKFSNGNSMWCSQCQTFKPPASHHCRTCNRCISRMDHHCPWMNNCVGAANLKHFILFLLYTWICSTLAMYLLGWNHFFCATNCTSNVVLVQLVRVMMVLCVFAFLFTSSMLMNVCYGLLTGIGTIDRLKKKAANTMSYSDEEPIALKDVFGISGFHTWPFPVDPVFEDFDRVMGYSTPQRLLREQLRVDPDAKSGTHSSTGQEDRFLV